MAMLHRIAHWFGWNHCTLETLTDAMYLRCVKCGKMEWFVDYSFTDRQIDRVMRAARGEE